MVKVDETLLEHLQTYSIEELEEIYGLHKGFVKNGKSIIILMNMMLEDICSEVEEDENCDRQQ